MLFNSYLLINLITMKQILESSTILKELNKVTQLTLGDQYFQAVGKLISDVTHADYTYITRINHEAQLAEPIVSLKYGVPIANVDYPLKTTPCLTVSETCTGYYPENVQELFPDDQFLKDINITGYLGTSVVPPGHDDPMVILTCLYEHKVDQPQLYLEILEFIAKNIEDRVEHELLVSENNKNKTLLKEIHHRVKNNLQIVSSLLNLQKNKLSDPEAIELIHMSQDRIQAIALVHELLYNSTGFDKLNIRKYIQSITKNMVRELPEDLHLHVKVDSIDYDMDLDEITPCGLILSELISNSLKYAYKNDNNEHFLIIEFNFDKQYRKLTVRDNGIGYPEKVLNKVQLDSLGLELIESLTDQLNGNLRMYNNDGAVTEVVF